MVREEDGSVSLQVYKIDKDGSKSTKMYERRFNSMHTKEIRIYGFDGDDKFVVNGSSDKIKIRLIGGGGSDVFEYPLKTQSDVIVYDKADGNNLLSGGFKNKMSNDTAVNSFRRLDYKYQFQSFFVMVGYNPDDGLFLGPTFKYIRHGFRKSPYKSINQFKGLYAFSTKAVNVSYHNEFISVFGKRTDIVSDIDYKGPNNTSNFLVMG